MLGATVGSLGAVLSAVLGAVLVAVLVAVREVLGATTGSWRAVLGVVLLALREVVGLVGAVLDVFGCCQGCGKLASVLERRTLTMSEVAGLVCCRYALKSKMLLV